MQTHDEKLDFLHKKKNSAFPLKSLGRSSAVNKLIEFTYARFCVKILQLLKQCQDSTGPIGLFFFMVEYEIANNVIHAHWMPAVS